MAERTVLVGEPEAAVELGVVAELLLDAGAVVLITEPLDRVAGEAFGLVDDDQLEQGPACGRAVVRFASSREARKRTPTVS